MAKVIDSADYGQVTTAAQAVTQLTSYGVPAATATAFVASNPTVYAAPTPVNASTPNTTGDPNQYGFPTVTPGGTLALTGDSSTPFTATADSNGGVTTNVVGPDGTYVSTNATGTAKADGSPLDPTVPKPPALDWAAWMTNWGFDQATIDGLTAIFAKYTDPVQAAAAGVAYIRGTDWYAQHFQGIGEGERNGLFSDEQGYRSYVNDLNQTYQNFFGRAPTSAEVAGYMGAGQTVSYINLHFTGQARLKAEQPQDQYLLGAYDENGQATDTQLGAYGDTLGGIGNTLGPQLQAKIDRAKAKYQSLFTGSLASPSLSILNGRPVGQSLGRDVTKPDIAA
jgi:hypothetical protein